MEEKKQTLLCFSFSFASRFFLFYDLYLFSNVIFRIMERQKRETWLPLGLEFVFMK